MSVVRYLNPWKLKRERAAARLAALRQRDGDNCARCRRPLRFDLPAGHDQGAAIEEVAAGDQRLCHRRCNAPGLDHTGEVTARLRRKSEAVLFETARKRRRKAA